MLYGISFTNKKNFIIIYSLISAVLCLLIFFITSEIKRSLINDTKPENEYLLEADKQVFETVLSNCLSESLVMAEMTTQLLSKTTSKELQDKVLSGIYKDFATYRSSFYNTRFFGLDGMEHIRVDITDSGVYIVPKKELQNKRDRYYMVNGLKLENGVYISKFDLNVEHGKVEVPYKPMIRFITPIKNFEGKKLGIFVLNYLGQDLLDKLRNSSRSSHGSIYLVNNDGYWLLGPDPEDEWGFMFDEGKSKTFSSIYPDDWNTISKSESGQHLTKNNLVTFKTISPLSINQEGRVQNLHIQTDEYWKIISIVPLSNIFPPWLNNIRYFYALALLFSLFPAYFLMKTLVSREIARTDLKIAQSQLIQQEKLAGLGQLAAGVAHEINNPLGYILSNFRTLEKYVARYKEAIEAYRDLRNSIENKGNSDVENIIKHTYDIETNNKIDFITKDLKDLLNDSFKGLDRINKIVTGLRNFSHVNQQGDFSEYDLNAGIKDTLIVANNEIKYYAKIEEKPGNIPAIYANGGQINQVLLNIIINAVHAIKAKGINEPGLIGITTSSDSQYVYCTIEDNGTGIEKEHLTRIFEPFFTTKKVGQGTGLGLSISYDIIVNKHNGGLEVRSELGAGTRFIIRLPIKERLSS